LRPAQALEGYVARKALTKLAADGLKVHSFQTLLAYLATIAKNKVQPYDKVTAASPPLQERRARK